jgi:type IV pilus assembly protein PilC
MIKVGEDSGTLEESLNYLVVQLEKNYELRQKMIAAMIYPSIILIAIIIVSSFVVSFILPKITDIFKDFKFELPFTTKILIYSAEVISNYGLFILGGIVFLFLILSLISKIKAVKALFHWISLRLPIFGKMIQNMNLVYFTRSLGILLKSGVPLISALDITKTILSNVIYQKQLEELAERVKEGRSLSDFLEGKEHLFPSVLYRMIEVGEKTGSLEETLIYLGNFYESELDRFLKTFTTIFEPLLLLFVGVVVGFVALAILPPLYEVTRSLSP